MFKILTIPFLMAEEVGLCCVHLEGIKSSFFHELRPGSHSVERFMSQSATIFVIRFYSHFLISTVLFL